MDDRGAIYGCKIEMSVLDDVEDELHVVICKPLYGNVKENDCIQCQHLIPALNAWADRAYDNARPYARLPPDFMGLDV